MKYTEIKQRFTKIEFHRSNWVHLLNAREAVVYDKFTMGENSMQSYQKLYITTAKEYLKSLHKCILTLIENPEEQASIEEAYIASHSLKSQSIAMGYQAIADICGDIEYVFHNVKTQKQILSEKFLHTFLSAIEKVQQAILALEKEESQPDLSEEIKQIKSLIDIK